MRFQAIRRLAGRGGGAGQFARSLRGLAIDATGNLLAAGDSAVKVFDAEGRFVRQWATGRPAECVAVDREGRAWVGEYGQVEVFSAEGDLLDTWRDPGTLGLVTAIGFGGSEVFLGDSTARWIRRYSAEKRLLNNIGDQHRKGGFHIPNGAVDFAVDGAGTVHVANPGMHRVERYSPGGELLGRFGRFDGQDPAGFPGCCNPTNLTVDDTGQVIVSEKAGPRVKVYDPEGVFLGVVAAEEFDPAAKNMDLATDGRGRLYVADTATLEIHVFERVPAGGEGAS